MRCGAVRCSAVRSVCSLLRSQCCAHGTVPCSIIAAGVLAMVPATTLKRMLGRSVGWVFDAEYGAVLGVNALDRLYLGRADWRCLDCLPCLPACLCLSVCLSVACLVCAEGAAGTSAPLSPRRVGMKSSCHPAKQPSRQLGRSVPGGAGHAWQAARARTSPGARNQELDPLGRWMGGQMRGSSCCVAHESKQLPCAGTTQRAVPIKGACGN